MRRSRLLLLAASIAAVVAPLAAVAEGCSTSTHSSSADPSSATLAQLEQDTGVHWLTFHDYSYGATSFLKPSTPPGATLTGDATPAAVATAFFAKYGALFSVVDPAHELTLESSGGSGGFHYAAFTQTEGAASVYGTRLTVVFDKAGRVAFVSGLFVPGLHGAPTTPTLSPADAVAKAQADMATRYPKGVLLSLESTAAPVLTLYTVGEPAVLAYTLTISYATDMHIDSAARSRIATEYVVDAASGAILEADDTRETQHSGAVIPVVANGQGSIASEPTKGFPAVATPDSGAPTEPYYLQNMRFPVPSSFQGMTAPRFAYTPASTPVVQSDDLDWWDQAGDPDVASAVDAYVYVGVADAWWHAHGRNSYDGKGAAISIIAGDPTPIGTSDASCANNAYWDGEGEIHVCPNGGYDYPVSADLNVIAHEYQHAVTQYALHLRKRGQSGALRESLSDVFGQIIAHATPPYDDASFLMGQKARPPIGVRDLQCPHRSVGPTVIREPQPDNVNDPLYTHDPTDTHRADGIPNKAWYLASFGGKDFTSPFISVVPSPKLVPLDWKGSEDLYVSLLLTAAVPPTANFANVALALTTLAANSDIDSDTSPATNAVGCAWYAVGVLAKSDLDDLGVDSCLCALPDAGSCDAGMDAGKKDAAPDAGLYPCTASYDACTIVSASDVASAVGAGLGSGKPEGVPGFWQCGYPAEDVDAPDASPTLVFNLTCMPESPEGLAPIPPSASANQTVMAVSGLGDEAYWTTTTNMTPDGTFAEYELSVWKKNLFLTFDFEQGDAFPPLGQAEALARDALANLTGDAGTPPPGDAGAHDASTDAGDAGPDDDGC